MSQARVFSSTASSSMEARRFILSLIGSLSKDLRDSVEVMVSELATNAALHAVTDFEIGISYSKDEDCLRVAVTDRGPGEPALQRPSVADAHGRGLQIVSMLSDRWGIDWVPDRLGKTVWFELATDPGRTGPASPPASESRGRACR